jgi:hypothetical protein
MRRTMMATAMMAVAVVAVAVTGPMLAGAAVAQPARGGLIWIDEHARWNAEHMAAARRLETIVAALKRHDSNFDMHGNTLRDHVAAAAGKDRAVAALAQARLRAEHEEARSAHHHLMADVDALAAVMAEKFGDAPQ